QSGQRPLFQHEADSLRPRRWRHSQLLAESRPGHRERCHRIRKRRELPLRLNRKTSMLDDNDLQTRALAAAANGIRAIFRGDYEFVPQDATNRWDPILKRHTFVQPMEVCRTFDSIQMRVSDSGEVVAFSDRNRMQ